MEGRLRAAVSAYEDDIALAWHIETMARQGKHMKPLRHYLEQSRVGPPKPQTGEEMVEALRAMGGDKMTIRFIPKGAADGVRAVEPGGGEGA